MYVFVCMCLCVCTCAFAHNKMYTYPLSHRHTFCICYTIIRYKTPLTQQTYVHTKAHTCNAYVDTHSLTRAHALSVSCCILRTQTQTHKLGLEQNREIRVYLVYRNFEHSGSSTDSCYFFASCGMSLDDFDHSRVLTQQLCARPACVYARACMRVRARVCV